VAVPGSYQIWINGCGTPFSLSCGDIYARADTITRSGYWVASFDFPLGNYTYYWYIEYNNGTRVGIGMGKNQRPALYALNSTGLLDTTDPKAYFEVKPFTQKTVTFLLRPQTLWGTDNLGYPNHVVTFSGTVSGVGG
jgi:hypothetical protein